jgi:hypothetical protein
MQKNKKPKKNITCVFFSLNSRSALKNAVQMVKMDLHPPNQNSTTSASSTTRHELGAMHMAKSLRSTAASPGRSLVEVFT